MAMTSPYIADSEYQRLLDDLNVQFSDDESRDSLLARAIGDMETDLSERFVVPLVEASGLPFANAPQFAQQKVLNALKCKIRQIVGNDKNRNLVIDSTQKFIDLAKSEYKDHKEALLNAKIIFGFKMQPYAEGSVVPEQKMGIARADNSPSNILDTDDPLLY